MAFSPGDRTLAQRLAAGSFIVLVILLPALLAFRNIASPPAPGERERIVATLSQATVPDTALGFFFGLTMPEDAARQWADEELRVVVQARRAGMLALLGISGLLYVLVALVRGRTAAVLSCLCLCLVPAVTDAGHVLRPEQCATMIALLGVLLVHLYPDALRRRGRQWSRWLNLAGIVVCVSLCFAVAMVCLPQAGVYLLLPGGALLLVALCLAAVFPRVVRRRSIWRWPYQATTARLLPWIAMGMGNLVLGYVVLVLSPGEVTQAGASPASAGMLPAPWYLQVPAFALLLLGGARLVLGVGLRLGRRGHVGRDALLLIYAAALLLDHLRGPARDHLPAAPALAILMGEGASLLLLLGAGHLASAGKRS